MASREVADDDPRVCVPKRADFREPARSCVTNLLCLTAATRHKFLPPQIQCQLTNASSTYTSLMVFASGAACASCRSHQLQHRGRFRKNELNQLKIAALSLFYQPIAVPPLGKAMSSHSRSNAPHISNLMLGRQQGRTGLPAAQEAARTRNGSKNGPGVVIGAYAPLCSLWQHVHCGNRWRTRRTCAAPAVFAHPMAGWMDPRVEPAGGTYVLPLT
jgi:hypothetical protein